MATIKTLKRLARQHTECLVVGSEIKELMPEADALKLLENGFTDCSWGNDECPSYYKPKRWADDEWVLVPTEDKEYCVTNYRGAEFFASIDDAINYYNAE